MSPRIAHVLVSNKPSGYVASSAKRNLLPEEKATASVKKAKTGVPASTEEHKYDFNFMIDVIESAAYDAKSDDISSLGQPNDVTKMVMKH